MVPYSVVQFFRFSKNRRFIKIFHKTENLWFFFPLQKIRIEELAVPVLPQNLMVFMKEPAKN